MTEIFRTTVTGVGPLAESFLAERMFVTFGENAPDTLREFCYLVAPAVSNGTISTGLSLTINGVDYPITAVGEVAQRNLDNLGHVTIVLDGAAEAAMDGNIHINAAGELPTLGVGSSLVISGSHHS